MNHYLVSKFKTLRIGKSGYWRALRKLIDTNADCLKGRRFGTQRVCHSDVNGAPTGPCPAVQLTHRGSGGELPPDLPPPIRQERQSLAQRSQVLPLVTTLLYSNSAFCIQTVVKHFFDKLITHTGLYWSEKKNTTFLATNPEGSWVGPKSGLFCHKK